MNKLKIFISYAKHDFELMKGIEYLCNDLNQIDYKGQNYKIEVWCDQYINPGESWKPEVIDNIKDADVILFLISKKFLKSEFILTNELPLALKRRAESGIGILGILMEDCDY